ncbi:hypothetical protein NKI96_10640 [Mesorhizobium sp. M0292]
MSRHNRKPSRAAIRKRRETLQKIALYLGVAVVLPASAFLAFIVGSVF